jgi:hypothetical protein
VDFDFDDEERKVASHDGSVAVSDQRWVRGSINIGGGPRGLRGDVPSASKDFLFGTLNVEMSKTQLRVREQLIELV